MSDLNVRWHWRCHTCGDGASVSGLNVPPVVRVSQIVSHHVGENPEHVVEYWQRGRRHDALWVGHRRGPMHVYQCSCGQFYSERTAPDHSVCLRIEDREAAGL